MSKPITYCSVPGCETRCCGNGMCSKHYARIRRRGSLETVKAPNGDIQRWAEKALSTEADDCILFPFPLGSHGYGSVTVEGRKDLIHRYMEGAGHGCRDF